MATRKEINKIKRRIEFLMSNTFIPLNTNWDKLYSDASVAIIVSGICWSDCLTAPFEQKDYLKVGHIRVTIQIMVLAMEIKMTQDEVKEMWVNKFLERTKDKMVGYLEPQKEGRDNKGVKVGSSGSHGNKIRYPKLNRSKKVWAMFYKMFPYYAEKDNWDGEKSDRFPRKKKKK